MDPSEPLMRPPRWVRGFLLLALPCDPMRDAILGDLHEEFLDDAQEFGAQSARVRYARRTAGIAVRAMSDAMIWRAWVSTGPEAELSSPPKRPHKQGAGGFAGFVLAALIVLVLGVVMNTILFSATTASGTRVSSAAGVGGIVLLVASVGIGAVVMCAGPRWRRNRRRGA